MLRHSRALVRQLGWHRYARHAASGWDVAGSNPLVCSAWALACPLCLLSTLRTHRCALTLGYAREATVTSAGLRWQAWLILACFLAGSNVQPCLPLLARPFRQWGSGTGREVCVSRLQARADQHTSREPRHPVHSGEAQHLLLLDRVNLCWNIEATCASGCRGLCNFAESLHGSSVQLKHLLVTPVAQVGSTG